MTDSLHRFAKFWGQKICSRPWHCNLDRVENREALTAVLQEKLMTWRKVQCLAALEQTVVPAGPIDAIE